MTAFRIAALWIVLVLAGVARAAPIPAVLTLTIDIEGLASFSVSGTATVDVTAGVLTIPAALSLASTINIPLTSAIGTSAFARPGVGQLAGSFRLGGVSVDTPAEICPAGPTPRACIAGGGLNGPMQLTGTLGVKLGGGVTSEIFLRPALIGVGGTTTQPSPVTGIFLLENGVWTTRTGVVAFTTTTTTTVLVLGQTFSMSVPGVPRTETRMGTRSGPLGPGGMLSLVTPTYLRSLGTELPTFTTLEVRFVPEPGAIFLVGTCVAALLALVRRRS